MADIICYKPDGDFLKYFTQWDVGQKIHIKGIDTAIIPEFHFCNSRSDEAFVTSSILEDDTIIVDVPDVLLQDPLPITIHIYCQTNDRSAETEYTINVPVRPRVKPDDYTYEEKRTGILTLLNLVYPIGAVYSSTINRSPTEFLIGSWNYVGTISSRGITVYMWERVA